MSWASEQLVVNADRRLDLLVQLLAALDVLRRKPDAQVRIAHPPMQPPGELLVLGAVGDEAGVELDAVLRADERVHLRDEALRHTAPAQEALGDFAFGFVDRVEADGGRA